MQTIRIDKVNKRFGQLDVLSDIDFTIEKGEFAAIVGPSGCGKSTVLRMIAGLETPSGGQVLANGEPIRKPDPQRVLIFQEHALYPWRTVEDNVGFGLELAGVPPKERRYRVDEVLEKVGLSGFQKYFPAQLSGGMKQRASIARALVMNPEVLLLDEPYGALDAITRLTMQNELIKLWRGTGKTVLLITHDIDEAVYLADTIYVMSPRPGRIIKKLQTDMPRPRNRNSAEFVRLRQEIMDSLDIGTYNI
ncbi:ABC transporter ATP-binding protein [Paenibacillus flagellatus]|uniref:Carnitine transport ATP-binding protein OpuCA n=1 Tax=Paenibacillus flagellatus TaxID=2211139 RepID=A0A2V5KP29_9BACL|nr:ABC transporter ATP-binding protein [Paenibacillus flagellatus]PYI52877.1 ABC transporter ATP-binding protein [Paenibacillus flagellatus]